MPPKRISDVGTTLHRFNHGLRRLFRSPDHAPRATESYTRRNIGLNNTNWDGLGRFSSILNRSSSAFGPLVAAIGRFSACIKRFEEQAVAREEYMELGADLNDLFDTLAGHFEATDHASTTVDRLESLAWGIDHAIKQLESVGDGETQGDGESMRDVAEVLWCYRQVNEIAKTWKVVDDEALNTRIELLLPTPNAHYRAVGSKNVRRNGCMPNTRTGVLQDLREWVHYGKFHKVYWLSGIAGTGKTTIAYSLCEWLENSGKPATSFFCSRDLPDCRDVKRILPTVSHQLARLSRPFRLAISTGLGQDTELFNRPIDEQFKRLIAEPFQKIGHTFGVDVVIVLDALDECEDKDGMNQILDACFNNSASLPVRFLITSRQNLGILDRMRASQGGGRRSELKLHEVDRTVAQEDIRTYLRARLGRFGLSDYDLECLAKQSGGSFTHAASIVQYLGQGDVAGGAERLKRLLDIASCTESTNDLDIDTMYTAILEEAMDSSGVGESGKAEIMLVLRVAVCARDSLALGAIAELLGLDFSRLMSTTLHLLLPTLQVSDASGLGITLRESFSAYLLDPQRSGRFHCEGERNNGLVAQLCLQLISAVDQPFNICNLDSSYLLDREVVDMGDRMGEAIPDGLWHASRHWGTHLKLAKPSEELFAALHRFLSRRLLLWMEIMNLKRSMPEAVELLQSVYLWLKVERPVTSRNLVRDAWKFVEACSSSVVSDSTPHIHVSALRFWPAHRPVSMYYLPMLRNVVKAKGARRRLRVEISMSLDGPDTRIFRSLHSGASRSRPHHPAAGAGKPVDRSSEGHTNRIWSVAYSPDGAYIASGSSDDTVRIWDAHTGQPVGQPLNGHTSGVLSIAYSPDGAYIASGSDDKTVRIWDAHTGQPVGQPLNGHNYYVRSVAYSPDGAYIASGSDDKTVRIWDAHTGQPVGQPLNSHIAGVLSVAYSPDGAHIASGSSDNTVRIWDAHTGQPVGRPLKGHTDNVWSVAYSPDGAYIASGSNDKTVRIWDAFTGQPVGQPLNGHTDRVRSVAYSPDGAYIASGSNDKTVRIWDAHTGQPVGQPLNGHTSIVWSVAYSPDGAYIASGAWDRTVRIWAAHTGQPLSEPFPSDPQPGNRSLVSSALARFLARTSTKPNPAIASSRRLTRTFGNLLPFPAH
ncbi:hypothetical protein FRC10_010368 [Ceratobasidium sp. 414]|nr:hypothetical protein FRC10_010368 [Ceratobasidium sp. 414]